MFQHNIVIVEPPEEYRVRRTTTISQVLKIYSELYEYTMLRDAFNYRNKFLVECVQTILACNTKLCDDVINLIVTI